MRPFTPRFQFRAHTLRVCSIHVTPKAVYLISHSLDFSRPFSVVLLSLMWHTDVKFNDQFKLVLFCCFGRHLCTMNAQCGAGMSLWTRCRPCEKHCVPYSALGVVVSEAQLATLAQSLLLMSLLLPLSFMTTIFKWHVTVMVIVMMQYIFDVINYITDSTFSIIDVEVFFAAWTRRPTCINLCCDVSQLEAERCDRVL